MRLFPSIRKASRRKPLYAIAFALILLVASGCNHPGKPAPNPEIRPLPQVIRVGTSGDYAPFSLWEWPPGPSGVSQGMGQSAAGFLLPRPPGGFSVELALAYAEARGISIEWVKFRWPELQGDLARGRFDLALSGVTVRADRALQGRFSLPLTTSGAVALMPRAGALGRALEAGTEPRAVLNRPEVRIAVNAGGHLESVTRRLFPLAEISAIEANGQVLAQLQASGPARVDAVMTDSREAPHWQKERAGLIASPPLTQDRKAAWFARERTHLLEDFDAWLLGFEAEGGLAELRRRADLPAATTARPVEALWATLDDRLGLMTRVADCKRILAKPIEDLPREARVLDAAVAKFSEAARQNGLRDIPNEGVRRLFRAQIEAAKTIQRNHLAKIAEAHATAPSAPASATDAERAAAQQRLDEEIRPALIFLGDRITKLLVAARLSPDARPAPAALIQSLERHGLPAEQSRAIEDAVDALLKRDAETSARPNLRESAEKDRRRSA